MFYLKVALPLLCLSLLFSNAFAQSEAGEHAQLKIPRMQRAPVIEDFLEMKLSADLEGRMARVDDFRQNQPRDGEPASQRTEGYLGYDDKNLYIVFVCFDREPEKIRARWEKRENAFADDFVEVTLDTFHDRRRGYMFWSNPLGVQAEGIWTEEKAVLIGLSTRCGKRAGSAHGKVTSFGWRFHSRACASKSKISKPGA